MPEFTTLSIPEIQKLQGSMYVANVSDRSRTMSRGNVVFSVIDSTGQTINIVLPRTFIPIDLATYAPIDDIRRSNEFLTFIRKQALVVVDTKEAVEYLKSSEALAEIQRLRKDRNLMLSPMNFDSGVGGGKINTKSGMAQPAAPTSVTTASEERPINKELVDIINMFNKGGDDRELADEIHKLSDLEPQDIVWAMDKVLDQSSLVYLALSEVDRSNATFSS